MQIKPTKAVQQKMHIKPTKAVHEMNVSEAFSDLLESESLLKIFSKDRNISVVNRNLIRFTSPLINSILYDVPCCTSSMIFIPDVSKTAVDHVLSIIINGLSDFNSVSIKQIQEVQETAKMLQIDLTDLDYVKKSSIVDLVPEINSKKGLVSFDNHKDNQTNVWIETELPESNSTINTTSAEEAEDHQINIRIKSEVSELEDTPEYSETKHGNVYNVKNEQNDKYESPLHNESQRGLRIKCETFDEFTNSVLQEPSDVDNNFDLKEENDNLSESQIYQMPTPQISERVFPSSLESVETGMKLEKSRQNTVIQSLTLVPTPPPKIFKPSDTQSPSPQKESFPEDNVFNFKIPKLPHQPVSSPLKTPKHKLAHENVSSPLKSPKQNLVHQPVSSPLKSHQHVSSPPKSPKPELQYIYKPFFHVKCGKIHNRIEDCSQALPHKVCGKQHSYFKECDGSWMTVEKFEMVAMRWPMPTMKKMRKKTSGLEVPRRKRIRLEDNPSSSTMQKPYKEMSEPEKMLNTCKDWNNGLCLNCKFGNRKRHRCSKMISDGEMGEKICWGDHKEVDHEAEYTISKEKKKRRSISNDREEGEVE